MASKQPDNRPSLLARIAHLFLFRLIPALLIVGIVFVGFNLVRTLAGQASVMFETDQRRGQYAETATAIAPTVAPNLAETDNTRGIRDTLRLVQVFATNTPDAPLMMTNTPVATPAPPTAAVIEATRPLPTPFFPPDPSIDQVNGIPVPTRVPLLDRQGNDLMNILLLGGDDETTNDNFLRTDTMIIVSINRTTNTVAVLSLPRDIFVYIPGGADGSNGTLNRLNVAYAIGESNGWPGGGFGLLRQTILYNFGINVHYYGLVNFSGFETIIDALGGVDIAVDCAYRDYYPVEDFDLSRPLEENYELRTLDVGYYTMNGFDALWYARTRKQSDDFDRGRRQQQILRAMWRKLRESDLLSNFPTLWNQATEVVKTDLQFVDMVGLLPMALNMDINRVEYFWLTRTYHTTPWQTPSGEYVQLLNYDILRPVLEDFYQPPTENQIDVQLDTIIVYNATAHENWDRVAAERLQSEGYNAIFGGASHEGEQAETILIDRTGAEKGSNRNTIAQVLNVKSENIISDPDPNRTTDFEVILGSSYNSCAGFSVIPIDS